MKPINKEILEELSSFIDKNLGLHYPKERWADLESNFRNVTKDLNFDDPITCFRYIISNKVNLNQIKVLAKHMTIGETYFNRENNSLKVLKEKILPEFYYKENIKIWCAGCATGEEAYTLSILLNSIFQLKYTKKTILASDINISFLEKAKKGLYRDWSFRNNDTEFKENYFIKKDDKFYKVKDQYKENIDFFYLNLIDDAYPGIVNKLNNIDIIFCRNVLIYFNENTVINVIKKFYNTLTKNGYLFVSSVETSQKIFSDFKTLSYEGALIYTKNGKKNNSVDIRLKEEKNIYNIVLNKSNNKKNNNDIFNDKHKKKEANKKVINIADKLYKSDKPDNSEKLLIEFFESNNSNKDPEALYLLIKILADNKKLDSAYYWCKKAIEFDKTNPIFYYLEAIIHYENTLMEKSIESLKKVIYLDNNFIMANFLLANIYSQKNNKLQAKKYFNNTLLLLDKLNVESQVPHSDSITVKSLKEITRISCKNVGD